MWGNPASRPDTISYRPHRRDLSGTGSVATIDRLMTMRDRLFLISGLLGFAALAMTLFLTAISPKEVGPLPQGFITPVLAFEFAQTESEVLQLFRSPSVAEAMDRVNRWDFLYILLYGTFLAVFDLACARESGNRLCVAAAVLAMIIVAADALENVVLLGLSYRTTLDGGYLGDLLLRLRLYTWVKWGGLAAYFLLLWPYFQNQRGTLARIMTLLTILPTLLALWSLLRRGTANELMALAIGLMFLLVTVYAWMRAVRKERSPVMSTA